MLTREQLLGLATIIREETAQGLNTAQRVGHLLYEIASSFLLKSQDDSTSNKLSVDELEAVERLIVVGTQLVGQNNSALENIVSTIHGSQLIEGKQTVQGVQQNISSTYFGPQFVSGLLGKGGFIGADGAAELKSLVLREFLEAPELRLNRTTSVAGQLIQSYCNGIIESVTPLTASTGYFQLKLEDGEAGSCAAGDICLGIFHYGLGDATVDSDDLRGNVTQAGFTTTYFRVDRVRGVRSKIVYYTLRPHENPETHEILGYYPHPKAFMKFAGYGNFTNHGRQSSIILAHSYIRMVRDVDNWEFDFRNIALQIGNLDGLHEAYRDEGCPEMTGYSAYLRNIYFTGKIEQLDDDAIDSIRDKLKNYTVYISEHVDMVTVDDVGNVIGGLWKEETVTETVTNEETGEEEEVTRTYRTYRIHSAITVRNSNRILTKAADGQPASTGKYQLYPQPHGCSCFIKDSTLYITAIDNIKDGVAGTPDDVNFDYDLMRETESCSVDILVDCEGVGTITKQFPITIKHTAQPFVNGDLTNQFSAVSWNTRTQQYVGLPITFDMKMWHNNESLDIASADDVSVTPAIQGMTVTKTIVTNASGAKVARISITALPEDLPLVTDLNITAVANYSGIAYERTLVHTINKSTDANLYQLHPSIDEVGVVYNDNKQKVPSTDKVFCSVRCDSTDDKHYTVPATDYSLYGLYITYQLFTLDSNNAEVGGVEQPYSIANGVSVSTSLVRIRFKLYKLADTTLTPFTSLIAQANVIEVLDIEDVPVILDGLDGDNSIFVSLDNANDAVTCNENGDVIAPSLPSTHAWLMDGEDAIGGDVLGTTLAADKQSLGTFDGNNVLTQGWSLVCSNCTAWITGWVTVDGKPCINIDVKTVTDDIASVTVRCLYTSHGTSAYYEHIQSIKKLYGIDKYELQFSPNSVSYNPNTDTYTPESFMVYVYKTTQEEERHLMTSLVNNGVLEDTNSVGSLKLEYSVDKGVHWTRVTDYSSGKSIGKTVFDVTGVESVEFRIMQYVLNALGNGVWIVCDQEKVDITGDGESNVTLYLDNQNDEVIATEDGTVVTSTLPTTRAWVQVGGANVPKASLYHTAPSNVKIYGLWKPLECVGCTAEYDTTSGDGHDGYNANGGKVIRVTAMTADIATVTAVCDYVIDDVVLTRRAVLTVKKSKDKNKYEIVTDPVSVVFNPNNATYTPSSVALSVRETALDTSADGIALSRTLLSTLPYHTPAEAGDMRLMYYDGTAWTRLTAMSLGSTILAANVNGAVQLRLDKYDGTNWVDRDLEDVEVLREGADGKGIEFIFFADADWNAWDGTAASVQSLVDAGVASAVNGMPLINDVAAERQTADGNPYCPYTNAGHDYQWTDESTGTGENIKFEFYAKRVKVNGVWQAFGPVKEWNRHITDGQSPYVLDLSNERSFVSCDENGTPLSGATYEESVVMLLHGHDSVIDDFTIKVVPVGISCNGYYPNGGTAVSGQTQCPAGGFTLQSPYTLTPSHIKQDAATITVTATKGSLVFTETYRVNKSKAGQNAVIFSLKPSQDVCHRYMDGTYDGTNMSFIVKKHTGNTVEDLTTNSMVANNGLEVGYYDSSNVFHTINDITAVALATVFSGRVATVFAVRESTSPYKVHDKERINVVSDGDPVYEIQLTNVASLVNVNAAGTPYANAVYEKTKVLIKRGEADAYSEFVVTCSATGITCPGSPDSNHEIQPSAITADTATITVTAVHRTKANLTLEAKYTVSKNYAGDDGDPATSYALDGLPASISRYADGSFKNNYISVRVKKVVGDDDPVYYSSQSEWTNASCVLQYSLNDSSYRGSISNPASIYLPNIMSSSDTKITFYLIVDGVEWDKQPVGTTDDGMDGDFHDLVVTGTNRNCSSENSKVEIDGDTVVNVHSRGLTVVIIDPSTMTVSRYSYFDVYGDASNGNTTNTDDLLTYLRSYGTSDKVVCIYSYDAVYIHDRVWALLACQYGLGQNITVEAMRRSVAIICQKGLQPGHAVCVLGDVEIAVAQASVAGGLLVTTDADTIPMGQNLLEGSNFNKMAAWSDKNGTIVKEDYEGCNAYSGSSPSSGYREMLKQVIAKINGGPLKPSTWYTLSFYAKTGSVSTFIYPSAIDNMEKAYIDGEEMSPSSDGEKVWTLDGIYRRHVYTFKTLPQLTLKSTYTPSTTYKRQEIAVVPLSGGSYYDSSTTYYRGTVVKYGSYYYWSKGSGHSGNTPYSGSSYWIRLDDATDADIGTTWYFVCLADDTYDVDFTDVGYWRKISVDNTTLNTSNQRFADDERVLWRKYSGTGTTVVVQPKLEEGCYATEWNSNDKDRMGLTGCHERVFETFTAGQTYYNEENTQKDGIRYVDFYAKEDSSMASGYKVYMCLETHVAASTFNDDIGYWDEVSINVASAFFKYLIAKNATIKIMSSAQFTINDPDGSVVAGLANTTVPLWVGSGVPGSAPFRVTRAGVLYATGATVQGTINADAGYFKGELQGATGTFSGSLTSNDNKVLLTSTGVNGWGLSYTWRGFAVSNNGFTGGDLATIGARLNAGGYDYGRLVLVKRPAGTYSTESQDINIILSAYDGSVEANIVNAGSGTIGRLNISNCLRLNSSITFHTFYKKSLTSDNTIYDMYPTSGSIQIVNSTADSAGAILPQLADIYSMLGLSSGTNFVVRFLVCADLGSNNFYVYGRNNRKTSSNEYPWNDNKYPLMTHWDNSQWDRLEMGAGDSVEFLLVYDSARTATIDGYDTKFTARIINRQN